jgi:hypothetical protein
VIGKKRNSSEDSTPHKTLWGGDKNVQEEASSKEEERRKERGMVGQLEALAT